MGHYCSEMYSAFDEPEYAVPYKQNRIREVYETIEKNPLSVNDISIGSSLIFYSGLVEQSSVRITPNHEPEKSILDSIYLVFPDELGFMASKFSVNRFVTKKPLENIEFIVKQIDKKEKKVCLGHHPHPFKIKPEAWFDIRFFDKKN